jgi:hypothetical protein
MACLTIGPKGFLSLFSSNRGTRPRLRGRGGQGSVIDDNFIDVIPSKEEMLKNGKYMYTPLDQVTLGSGMMRMSSLMHNYIYNSSIVEKANSSLNTVSESNVRVGIREQSSGFPSKIGFLSLVSVPEPVDPFVGYQPARAAA